MTETDDVLARFHGALVEEILARRPEYLHAPFTVAEIYQNLVPYGTHRDRIGVEMNGDYEDALIRLLAGEGGYLVMESEPALRVLREELEATNPNTGLYREFAAVDVRLDQARLPGGMSASASSVPSSQPDVATFAGPAPTDEDTLEAQAAPMPPSAPEPVVVPPGDTTSPAPSADGAVPEACRWCRAPLPDRENLNFCPFCGTDVHVVPCPGCGEELEPDWRFCISCGTEVTA